MTSVTSWGDVRHRASVTKDTREMRRRAPTRTAVRRRVRVSVPKGSARRVVRNQRRFKTVAEKKIQPKDPSKKTTKKTEAEKDTKESRSKAARVEMKKWKKW